MTRYWPLKVSHGLRKWILHALLVLLFTAPISASGSEQSGVAFSISPKRCVTLRQGQPCFVRIRIEWQSSKIIEACVYGVEGKEVICWQPANQGKSVIAQTLPGTTEFVLVDDEGIELSRTEVSVSWVYKKKRSNRRWRLF